MQAGLYLALWIRSEASVIERVISLALLRFTSTTITERVALLKELAKIRDIGYAIDNEEHQPGLRCIGAPIRNASGKVFAGFSVSGPVRRITPARFDDL